MPAPHRDLAPGIFHVFTHCVWAAPAHFRDEFDYMTFLRHLATTTSKSGWTCVAFCLMPTHYHLIVEVGQGVLPLAMHRLNLGYSCDFNKRHGLRGHAQSGRYGASRIGDDSNLLTVFAYVANNPVKDGLATSARDWQWSSYPGAVDLAEPHSFVDPSLVLGCFDAPDELAVLAQVRRFVEER